MAASPQGSRPSDLDRALAGQDRLFTSEPAVIDIAGPGPEPAPVGAPPAHREAVAAGPLEVAGLEVGAAPEELARSARSPTKDSSDSAEKPRTIGIVFVHGIGSQEADQILIEWTSPLVQAISAWQEANHDDLVGALGRVTRPTPGSASRPQPLDPVSNAEMDFTGDSLPLVRLNIPGLKSAAGTAAGTRQTWLITESWWASRVRPPTVAAMIDWCGRQGIVARVAEAILAETVGTGGGRRLVRALGGLGLGLFLTTMTTLALFAFGVLQLIAALVPIDAVKNATVFASFQTFLTGWWGDMYVLLRNPVEAANIRDQLASAIIALRKFNPDAIVVIGHSGGTAVAYTTLSDPALARDPRIRADLLITHGEAIQLSRRLTETLRARRSGTSTTIDRARAVATIPTADRTDRDGLRLARWVDFWANRDPAPTGPLDECGQVESGDHPSVACEPIWNRMSLSEDHGGYWDNDEEFVLPVLRQLDLAGLDPVVTGPSRFSRYGATADPIEPWQARHRERVWTLAFWRRLTFILSVTAILPALFEADGFFDKVASVAGSVWVAIGADKVWDALARFVAQGQERPYVELYASLVTLTMVAAGVALGAVLAHEIGWIGKHDEAFGNAGSQGAAAAEGAASLVALGSIVVLVAQAIARLPGSAYFIGLLVGLIVSVLLLGAFYLANIGSGRPSKPSQVTAVVLLAFGAIVVVFGALGTLAIDPQVRTWFVGIIATVLVFRQIDGFGATRWARWDEAERARARRGDQSSPGRLWVVLQSIWLLAASIAITIGIAIAPGVGWGFLVGGIAALIVLGIVMTVIDGAQADSRPGGAAG